MEQKQPHTLSTPPTSSLQEEILVVKREHLFTETVCGPSWHGLQPSVDPLQFDRALETVRRHGEFMERDHAEQNFAYKQIIPYMIFTHNDHYFIMQRRANASEARLRNKWSMGIGGHMRKEDIVGSNLFDWAHREFHEEVSYEGTLSVEHVGILNDDSTDVGKVHLGFVLLLRGNSPHIAIKSEHKSGHLASLDECAQLGDHLETWSTFVLAHLQQTMTM